MAMEERKNLSRLYVNGSAAPKLEPTRRSRPRPLDEPATEIQRQKLQTQVYTPSARTATASLPKINVASRFIAVITLFVVAACLLAVIAGAVSINNEYSKLNDVNNAIAQKRDSITQLEVRLESAIGNQNLREKALLSGLSAPTGNNYTHD